MSIRVERPVGYEQWGQDFEADQFQPGVLTITDPLTGRVWDTYQSSRWCRAIVHDTNGYVAYVQINPRETEVRQAFLDDVRAMHERHQQLDAEKAVGVQ